MAGTSKKTKIITFRVPNEVYEALVRRNDQRTAMPISVNNYVRNRVIYDATRKHGTSKRKK